MTTRNTKPVRLTDPYDVAWAAGFCEGEATFDLHRGRYARVRVGGNDRDAIGRLATLFGVSVRMSLPRKTTHKAMFHAEASGPRAEEIMRALLPQMGARRSVTIATVLGHAAIARGATVATVPLHRPHGLPL